MIGEEFFNAVNLIDDDLIDEAAFIKKKNNNKVYVLLSLAACLAVFVGVTAIISNFGFNTADEVLHDTPFDTTVNEAVKENDITLGNGEYSDHTQPETGVPQATFPAESSTVVETTLNAEVSDVTENTTEKISQSTGSQQGDISESDTQDENLSASKGESEDDTSESDTQENDLCGSKGEDETVESTTHPLDSVRPPEMTTNNYETYSVEWLECEIYSTASPVIDVAAGKFVSLDYYQLEELYGFSIVLNRNLPGGSFDFAQIDEMGAYYNGKELIYAKNTFVFELLNGEKISVTLEKPNWSEVENLPGCIDYNSQNVCFIKDSESGVYQILFDKLGTLVYITGKNVSESDMLQTLDAFLV